MIATAIRWVAVLVGASSWGVVWKERYSHVVGWAWAVTLTAVAGLLTGSLFQIRFWLVMLIAMYLGGIVLRVLKVF